MHSPARRAIAILLSFPSIALTSIALTSIALTSIALTSIALTSITLPSIALSAERSGAERILNEAWGARPEHQKLGDQIYLADRYSDDTAYAYVLALVRQHRFDRAQKVLEQLLDRTPEHVDGWETRIWMKVARKEFRGALPDLTQLVANIPKEDPRRLSRLAVSGRLLGFIDVSLATADAELVLLAATEKIRRALPDTDWELFNAQRNRVHDRFSDMLKMRNETVEELDTAFQEDKKKQLAEIDQDRKSMRTQLDELDQQSTTLRDELQGQLAELERVDQPLRQQLMTLDSMAASVAGQLGRIESRIFYLERRLYSEEDSAVCSWIRRDLSHLESLARRYDRDLTDLDIRASRVQSERYQLRSGAGPQLSALQNDLNAARQEGSQVRDDLKSAANIEKKLKKSKGPGAKAGWRITLRARTLGTYYSYSPEVKRGQFLEDLAAKDLAAKDLAAKEAE